MNSTSCVFCNTNDHASTKCPLICKLCQNWGHRTISCPLLICKHCKQQGHIRTKCPLLKEQCPLRKWHVCNSQRFPLNHWMIKDEQKDKGLKLPKANLPNLPNLPRPELNDKKGIQGCLSVKNLQVHAFSVDDSSSPDTTSKPFLFNSSPAILKLPEPKADLNANTKTLDQNPAQGSCRNNKSQKKSSPQQHCPCKSTVFEVVCKSCPTFNIFAQEDVMITDSEDFGGDLTILCAVQNLPKNNKSVKIFKDSKYSLNGNGFISSLSVDGKLFLTLKLSKPELEETRFSVHKGDRIALCQISDLTPPPEPKSKADVSVVDDVQIPPGQIRTVKLRLLDFEYVSNVKPEILLLHFSTQVPERPNLVIKKGRVSLQEGNIFLLPIHNKSEVRVILRKDLEFGLVELYFNSKIPRFEKNFIIDPSPLFPQTSVDAENDIKDESGDSTAIFTAESNTDEYTEPLKSEVHLEIKKPSAQGQIEKKNELLVFVSLQLFQVGHGNSQTTETKTISVQVEDEFKSFFVTPLSYIKRYNSKELVNHGYRLIENCYFFDGIEKHKTLHLKSVIREIVDLVTGVQSSTGISNSNSSLVFRDRKEYESFLMIIKQFSVNEYIKSIITRVYLTNDVLVHYWPSPEHPKEFNSIAKTVLNHPSAFYEVPSTPFSGTNLTKMPLISINLPNPVKNPSLKRQIEKEPQKKKRLKTTGSLYKEKCCCYLNPGYKGIKMCLVHPPLSIKSLVEIQIQPNTLETILCKIEYPYPSKDPHIPSSIKVFPLMSDQPSSFSLVLSNKPRIAYDGMVYLILRNLGCKPLLIEPGTEYALGNEILPRGIDFKEPLIQEHVALLNHPPAILDDEETSIVLCKPVPPLPQGTLVAVRNIETNSFFSVNGIYTVQESGKLPIKIKNLTKSKISLSSDHIVGHIVTLMDHSGMCFVQNPIFESDNMNSFDMEKLEGLKNCIKLRDAVSPCSHAEASSGEECPKCPMFHIFSVCEKTIPSKGTGLIVGIMCMLDNFPELNFGTSRENFLKIFPEPNYSEQATPILNHFVRIYNNQFVCVNVLNDTQNEITISENSLLATAQTFKLDKNIPIQRIVRFHQCEKVSIKPGETEQVQFSPTPSMERFFLDVSLTKLLILTSENLGLSIAQTPAMVESDLTMRVMVTNNSSKIKVCKSLELDAYFNAFNLKDMTIPNFIPVLPGKMENHADSVIHHRIKYSYRLKNINKFSLKPRQVLSVLTLVEDLPEFCRSISVLGDSKFCEEQGLSLIPSRQHVFCRQFVFVTFKNTSDKQINIENQDLTVALGFPLPYESKCQFTSVEVKVSADVEIKAKEDLILNCYASFNDDEDENEEMNTVVSLAEPTFEKVDITSVVETMHYERDTDTTRIKLEVSNSRDTEIKLQSGETICKAFPMMSEPFVKQILKISNFEFNLNKGSLPVQKKVVTAGKDGKAVSPGSRISCSVCRKITHCVKCTSCPLYPVYTVGDVQLLGNGAVTVLVRSEFPPDLQPKFVQTFTSSQFHSTKIANKSLGISKKTVRKIFNSQYFFLTIFFSKQEKYSGFMIKKGFHIADCQLRRKAAYLDSVCCEMGEDEILPAFLTCELILKPGESRNVEFQIKNDKGFQNKENTYQLYKILDVDKLMIKVSSRFCTSKGLRKTIINMTNESSIDIQMKGKCPILYLSSVMNSSGCNEILEMEKSKLEPRHPENLLDLVYSYCNCLNERISVEQCLHCEPVPILAASNTYLSQGEVYTILCKMELPTQFKNFKHCILSSTKYNVFSTQREIFNQEYVFVTIKPTQSVLLCKGSVVGGAGIRSKSSILKKLSAKEHPVYLDTSRILPLKPGVYTDVRLTIPEMHEQFSQTAENRFEPIKLVATQLLPKDLYLEKISGIPPGTCTSSDQNRLQVRIFNASSKILNLPRDRPLFLAETCLSPAGLNLYLDMANKVPEVMSLD